MNRISMVNNKLFQWQRNLVAVLIRVMAAQDLINMIHEEANKESRVEIWALNWDQASLLKEEMIWALVPIISKATLIKLPIRADNRVKKAPKLRELEALALHKDLKWVKAVEIGRLVQECITQRPPRAQDGNTVLAALLGNRSAERKLSMFLGQECTR